MGLPGDKLRKHNNNLINLNIYLLRNDYQIIQYIVHKQPL